MSGQLTKKAKFSYFRDEELEAPYSNSPPGMNRRKSRPSSSHPHDYASRYEDEYMGGRATELHQLDSKDKDDEQDGSQSRAVKQIHSVSEKKLQLVDDNSAIGYETATQITQKRSERDQQAKIDLAEVIELNRRLWGVVLPAICSQLMLYMMETISMIFVGSLNDTYATAGVGMALIFVNLTTHSTLFGFNYAISVQVPVAFGQNDLRECQRVLHRGRLLCLIFYMPLAFVQLFCYHILVGVGMEEDVAYNAYKFGIFLFIAIGFHLYFDCYRHYLNSTNQSKIVQYAVSCTMLVHLLLCYTFVVKCGLGIVGVGIAMIITCSLNMLFVMLWCLKMTPEAVKPIPRNPRELLRPDDVKRYMEIGGPCMLMCCAEWWSYEGIVIIATMISVSAVGSLAISYNYFSLIFQIPYGFQIGAVAVIGNIIGEENEKMGKALNIMTMVYASIISTIIAALSYTFSEEIAHTYTQDPDTVFLLERCLMSQALSIAILGFCLSIQGTLKALQKQRLASRILLFCLYAISLPAAYTLSIGLEIGVKGLWSGFAIGQLCITISYVVVYSRTDWQAVFQLNRERKLQGALSKEEASAENNSDYRAELEESGKKQESTLHAPSVCELPRVEDFSEKKQEIALISKLNL